MSKRLSSKGAQRALSFYEWLGIGLILFGAAVYGKEGFDFLSAQLESKKAEIESLKQQVEDFKTEQRQLKGEQLQLKDEVRTLRAESN